MFSKRDNRFSGVAIAVTSVGVLGILILYWQLSNDRVVTPKRQQNISQKNLSQNQPQSETSIGKSSDSGDKQQSPTIKQAIKPTNQSLSKVIGEWEKAAKTEIFNVSIPAKFEGQVLRRVKLNSKEKAIALTFDDGPATAP